MHLGLNEGRLEEWVFLYTTSGICIKSIKSCVFLLVMFFQVNSREAQKRCRSWRSLCSRLRNGDMVSWNSKEFETVLLIFSHSISTDLFLKLRHRLWFDDASLLWSLVSFDLSRWQQVTSHWTWDGPDLWGSGFWMCRCCQVNSWWWRLVLCFCFSYDCFLMMMMMIFVLWFLVGLKEKIMIAWPWWWTSWWVFFSDRADDEEMISLDVNLQIPRMASIFCLLKSKTLAIYLAFAKKISGLHWTAWESCRWRESQPGSPGSPVAENHINLIRRSIGKSECWKCG